MAELPSDPPGELGEEWRSRWHEGLLGEGEGKRVPAHRVLVVDDDDAIREVAQMSLEIVGGFETRTASSGSQAWESVRTEIPDAVLLDVMMPGMDGPSLLALFRSDPRTQSIPIIFLTAKILAGDRRNFDDLDISGVIAKPFDPMELPGEIRRLLGW